MEIKIKQKSIKIPTYNIENFKIKGEYARGIFTIPFSITEKPIIPSVNRGRKVANLCGGIKTRILKDEMTRAPLISCKNPEIIRDYIKNNSNKIKEVMESTTNHGKLKSMNLVIKNSELYIRIGMDTGNAAGHNIITKASQKLLNHLIEKFPDEISFCSVSGNYCTDKKPAKINVEKGRE